MSGKGSRQRPTDASKYDANWERIFRGTQSPPKRDVPSLANEPGMATECLDCPPEASEGHANE